MISKENSSIRKLRRMIDILAPGKRQGDINKYHLARKCETLPDLLDNIVSASENKINPITPSDGNILSGDVWSINDSVRSKASNIAKVFNENNESNQSNDLVKASETVFSAQEHRVSSGKNYKPLIPNEEKTPLHDEHNISANNSRDRLLLTDYYDEMLTIDGKRFGSFSNPKDTSVLNHDSLSNILEQQLINNSKLSKKPAGVSKSLQDEHFQLSNALYNLKKKRKSLESIMKQNESQVNAHSDIIGEFNVFETPNYILTFDDDYKKIARPSTATLTKCNLLSNYPILENKKIFDEHDITRLLSAANPLTTNQSPMSYYALKATYDNLVHKSIRDIKEPDNIFVGVGLQSQNPLGIEIPEYKSKTMRNLIFKQPKLPFPKSNTLSIFREILDVDDLNKYPLECLQDQSSVTKSQHSLQTNTISEYDSSPLSTSFLSATDHTTPDILTSSIFGNPGEPDARLRHLLEWLKSEVMLLRKQDKALLNQLERCHNTIEEIKSFKRDECDHNWTTFYEDVDCAEFDSDDYDSNKSIRIASHQRFPFRAGPFTPLYHKRIYDRHNEEMEIMV